jgi:NAD(P)H-nitrite reductase large subunit
MDDEPDDRDQLQQLHPANRGLKTVCRCNNIKYKTIERVIKEGAKSVPEVAAKTTATTGYCGGSCTPHIQKIIDEVHGFAPAKAPETKVETDADGEVPWWVRKN